MNEIAPNAPPAASPGPAVTVYRRLNHDRRVSHGAHRLWHYLRDRQNKSGKCWPEQRTIARDLGCKTHSLRGWTEELVSAGYLGVEKTGQNHLCRYTVLFGDDKGAMPEWATRRNAQKGNAPPVSCSPKGQADMPKGDTPRVAETGNGSNPNGVIPTSKLSAPELILRSDELKRVESAMSKINNSYDSHQEWSATDKAEFRRLKGRKKELMLLLNLSV